METETNVAIQDHGREEPTAVGDARLSDEAKKWLRFRVASRPSFDFKVFLFLCLSILIDFFCKNMY